MTGSYTEAVTSQMRRHRFLLWGDCENEPARRCFCSVNGINRNDRQKRFAAGASI